MGFDHNNFGKNVERTLPGEIAVVKLLNSNYKDLNISKKTNKDKKYDLRGTFGNDPIFIEVKEDFAHATTGNIVVEYESRGEPSGIETSEANYWIFRIHMKDGVINHLIITLEGLKLIVDEERYDRKKQMPHDSKNKTYLFKYKELKKHCKQL